MEQITFSLLTLILFFGISPANAQTEWELSKSNKGITVYTREIPESSIKEFKAETVIKANIQTVVEALQQVEFHPEWMSMVKLTKRLSEEHEIVQYNMSVPFPFKDRFVVMSIKFESYDGGYRFDMENSDFPPSKVGDMVQIEYIKGYWLFTKIDDNTTSVLYQFVSDPGGGMPDWLANAFLVKSPYETLTNLRKRLE